MPQNLASGRERGTGSAPAPGGEAERTRAGSAGPRGAHPAANHQLRTHFTSPGEGSDRPGNWGGGGNLSNGGRRTESGEPSAAWHEGGRQRAVGRARSPNPVRPRRAPRRPQRLPPGSAPARSGRLARPRPLLVFLFLVPGRASRSEEPGEAVPGGAAPPPAAGHRHGEAVGPGPSAGSAQGGVLRPESGPGGTDSAARAGVAQSIPSERGAGTTSYRRGCSLLLRGGASSRPHRPAPGRSQRPRPRPRRRPRGWLGRGLRLGAGKASHATWLRASRPNELRLQPT